MDEDTLIGLLESSNLPVAYHHFVTPPAPPYVVYLFTYSSNMGADNRVYAQADNYQVELYTKLKDPTSEKLIEDIFDANDVFWDKSETWLDSENLYQVVYEI